MRRPRLRVARRARWCRHVARRLDHRPAQQIISGRPSIAQFGRERRAEALAERPQQGVADGGVMRLAHAVGDVAAREAGRGGDHRLGPAQSADDEAERRHQLLALRAEVGACEERPRGRVEREEPPVEQRRGLLADRPDQREAVLHEPDLVGGHGTPFLRQHASGAAFDGRRRSDGEAAGGGARPSLTRVAGARRALSGNALGRDRGARRRARRGSGRAQLGRRHQAVDPVVLAPPQRLRCRCPARQVPLSASRRATRMTN